MSSVTWKDVVDLDEIYLTNACKSPASNTAYLTLRSSHCRSTCRPAHDVQINTARSLARGKTKFGDRSKAVLLLWIFYIFLSSVCYAFVRVCLFVLCGHLLGKGWPLGSRLWCLTVSLLLSHWYPGSGVVLDCIDSWYLHPYFAHVCKAALELILQGTSFAIVSVRARLSNFMLLYCTTFVNAST